MVFLPKQIERGAVGIPFFVSKRHKKKDQHLLIFFYKIWCELFFFLSFCVSFEKVILYVSWYL